jgi:lauroyl/myristoyl acyltransferase
MDMVTANASFFGLIYQHLPLDLTLEMFERINAWEFKNTIADRQAANAASVQELIAGVPSLAKDAGRIASEWAEYRIAAQAPLYALMASLERGEPCGMTIETRGGEHLDAAQERGEGVVIVVPHVGYFQAIPPLLVARGMRPTVMANAGGFDDMGSVYRATVPKLINQVDGRFVQDPGTVGAAVDALRAGRPAVLYPEFSLGWSGNKSRLRAPFLGREAWVPTGPARFARMTGADILPLTIKPTAPRHVTLEICPPIRHQEIKADATAASLRVFSWLEQVILETPHLWWCWPLLGSLMDVDGG